MTTIQQAIISYIRAKTADGSSSAHVAWLGFMLERLGVQCGGLRMEQATPDALRTYVLWLREQGLAHESQRGHIRAMKAMFKWYWEENDLDPYKMPTRRIKVPKPQEREPRALDLAIFPLLFKATGLDAQGVRDRAILLFMLDTGCRSAGLLGVKTEDLRLTEQCARVKEKGDKERIVPLTTFTVKHIRAWLAVRPRGAPTVFCSLHRANWGGALSKTGLRIILKRLARLANVKSRINPHSFRHALGRAYLSAGGNAAMLKQVMGHRDITTTLNFYVQYYHEEMVRVHQQFSPVHQIERELSGSRPIGKPKQ